MTTGTTGTTGTSGPGPGFADDAARYRLEEPIATGGMGEVWRGTDTVLDRAVAVKLLKQEYAGDADFRTRFQTEARNAAALHHPHVAAVFDFGTSAGAPGAGRPFLVMELVAGQPLSAILRPGQPMNPPAVRDLVAQAAAALGAAHAIGTVHRDVKPANLLVTPDGTVKVTDFGIARAAQSPGLTQPGMVIGTPQYLSPEQARGETAGPASDVYALGVVAFECLTGERPFHGDTPLTTALAHVRDPVPALPAFVPAGLAAVVHRALAKAPAERYADGSALADALRAAPLDPTAPQVAAGLPPVVPPTQVLTGVAPASPPPPTPAAYPPAADRRRPWWARPWVAAAAVAGLALAVVLVAVATSGDGTPADSLANDPTGESSATEQPPSEPTEPTTAPTTEEPTEEPTTEPTEEPSPEVTVVPEDYLGDQVDDVARELEDLGLDVDAVEEENPGDQEEGAVVAVEPSGVLAEGTAVTVLYWGPPPDDEEDDR